jgi:hypothetical protein
MDPRVVAFVVVCLCLMLFIAFGLPAMSDFEPSSAASVGTGGAARTAVVSVNTNEAPRIAEANRAAKAVYDEATRAVAASRIRYAPIMGVVQATPDAKGAMPLRYVGDHSPAEAVKLCNSQPACIGIAVNTLGDAGPFGPNSVSIRPGRAVRLLGPPVRRPGGVLASKPANPAGTIYQERGRLSTFLRG